MNEINIKFIADDTLETLKANIRGTTKKLMDNPDDSSWINNETNTETYVIKKYKIEDFNVEVPKNKDDRETDIKNSIKLYESLKHLPKYVLADERFWLWLMFEKSYKVCQILMPIKSVDSSVFKEHWLFSGGNRRGIFFGVLSRCYYRVAMTVDETLDDPYELSKFIINSPERFRGYTWRSISSQKHIMLGILKAEKAVIDKYGEEREINSIYAELVKDVSKLGSVKLIDAMSEDEIQQFVYKKYCKRLDTAIEEANKRKYIRALEMLEENTLIKVKKAAQIFESLDNYDDSKEQLNFCNMKIEELSKPKKKGIFSKLRNR